jgi:hypothetical protein|tara:strand:+ start:174 stop:725 length:552 start_codon:yes stop_codon:yes gene_type:complete
MTEQPKEWFRQGFGYREQSGVYIEGREVGYSLITDEGVGYTYYKDGGKEDVVLETSLEVCGRRVKDKEPAKVIYARNGDIHFEAPNGQITLKAKNIRLVSQDGDGEVTIQAGKTIEIDGPTARVKGTNVDITGKNSVNMIGNYVESAAGVQQSSASLVDIFQGSFIGQLLNSLGNLKKFLQLF